MNGCIMTGTVELDAQAVIQAPGEVKLDAVAVIVGGIPYCLNARATIFRAPIARIYRATSLQRITYGKKVRRGTYGPARRVW